MVASGGIEKVQPKPRAFWQGLWQADERLSLRRCLLFLTGVLMLVNLYLIFMFADTDGITGHVQRIFYFHVPLAIMSFVAFFVVFVFSMLYAFRRDPRWDGLAYAAAEVGVIFISLALLTGIIWGKSVWSTWWVWTPRLTTTLILWLIYVAYLMIRAYAPNQSKAAVYGAVMGIIGFADVLVVYFSVQWWPGIHPTPVVGPLAESGSLHWTQLTTLLFSLVTFLAFMTYLIVERMALRNTEDQIRGIRFLLRRQRADLVPGE